MIFGAKSASDCGLDEYVYNRRLQEAHMVDSGISIKIDFSKSAMRL